MEEKVYTQDGTVNLRRQPVLASKTGKWKACAFLVGKSTLFLISCLYFKILQVIKKNIISLLLLLLLLLLFCFCLDGIAKGYEAFERMAFYAVASNLVVYLTTQLHEDNVSSLRNVNNWSGAVWMTPILGAYMADSYLGRFWTFTLSSLVYALGMVLLTLAASIKFLKPTCSNGVCNKATSSQIAFFYSSLYIIAIGAGGTKPNISTFGADQFDDFDPDEKKTQTLFFQLVDVQQLLGCTCCHPLCSVYPRKLGLV
ncbi:hypothetical protein L1987_35314 [Smallanthus sonchifolius]|uniref:Uncharacterized protein n=1 Tax=Smallanthus sonchifolius TaxID=185202 RepID=A0ACB9HX20_9ASTR|nr:hypothetical protein L1987_35314 [Smallanthus sonchifolius]